MKTNLLDFNLNQLTEHFAAMGEKPFRAKQIMRWMHQMGEADFDAMTDIWTLAPAMVWKPYSSPRMTAAPCAYHLR